MSSLIEAINIKKSYPNKEVLKDVNFSINDGERVSVIGANGSGKSTLIEIILQTMKQTSGEIKYSFNKEDAYKVIGTQFQEANYPQGLKVKDIINFFADIYNVKDQDHIDELLTGFKLKEIMKVKVGGLSGGQVQRLNIMLALIHKPKILILDEITNGLDIKVRREIKNYIKDFVEKNNLTLIIISHNIEEISELSDRILFLNNGVIENDYSMDEVIKNYGSVLEYTDSIFGSEDV